MALLSATMITDMARIRRLQTQTGLCYTVTCLLVALLLFGGTWLQSENDFQHSLRIPRASIYLVPEEEQTVRVQKSLPNQQEPLEPNSINVRTVSLGQVSLQSSTADGVLASSKNAESLDDLRVAASSNQSADEASDNPSNACSATSGTLFTCGVNEARLGRKGNASILLPAHQELKVSAVAGSGHTILATLDGKVLTCGRNDSNGGGGHGSEPIPDAGQMGRPGGRECAQVSALLGERIVRVAGGRYHSVALSATGKVYTWGLNDWGQLGRQGQESGNGEQACTSGPRCRHGIPMQVKGALESVKIKYISSGRYWTLAVSEDGKLYTWGLDGCATNGEIPEQETAYQPKVVEGDLKGRKVSKVDSGYVLWIALTESGEVFTCNTQDDGYARTLAVKRKGNDDGELGRQGPAFVPGQVSGGLAGKKVVSIAAGRFHCLAATEDGMLFSWGLAGSVIGREGDRYVPGQVEGAVKSEKIILVAAGEYVSLAASAQRVFGFGRNGYGNLSIRQKELPVPQQVEGPLSTGEWHIRDLQAGFQHTLVIAQNCKAAENMAVEERTQLPMETNPQSVQESGPLPKETGNQSPGNTAQDQKSTVDLSHLYETFDNFTFPADWAELEATDATSYLDKAKAPSTSLSEVLSTFRPLPEHNAIVENAKDVFEHLPPAYESEFKNPCWRVNGSLHCLPFYNILGVSKCGTTDLYWRLSQHPDVYQSLNKGPHFWDECQYPSVGPCTVPPNGTFDGYIDLFSKAAGQIEANQESGIVGEASSNTFTAAGVYFRGAAKHLNVTIADLLFEAQPYLRLVVIFRNPTDRYFSAYHYYRNEKVDGPPSAEGFHERVVRDITAFQQCMKTKARNECARTYEPQQLIKGMYSEFLGAWQSRFPEDQILFLRNEDYSEAVEEHMKALFRFLGLRDLSETEWDNVLGLDRRNTREHPEPMWPETRKLLDDFYAPFNSELAQKLGDDRYLWLDMRDAT